MTSFGGNKYCEILGILGRGYPLLRGLREGLRRVRRKQPCRKVREMEPRPRAPERERARLL